MLFKVLATRERDEVLRVDAPPGLANVVEHVIVRDRPDDLLIDEPVNQNDPGSVAARTYATRVPM